MSRIKDGFEYRICTAGLLLPLLLHLRCLLLMMRAKPRKDLGKITKDWIMSQRRGQAYGEDAEKGRV